ncbi:phosphate ABC transporter membrane protein 2, PhoT family [Raineyella antarctica]|uniref:Phosphate transport system permease protein PstA n=1 Tax=Raineyella antarctica TaxID=1577474 RepID=A0A1G6GE26_9ACTN|nr:phosphate ABC transporter permease PstA [Raineyella antarctica]SDB80251.1 phosphate ABC transporter membrane protein 2, PhoT family [Raineyella antarctica]
MSTTTETSQQSPRPQRSAASGNTLKAGQLPSWSRAATLAGSLAVSAVIFLVAGWNWVPVLLVAALLFLVAHSAWTFAVEGRRHGQDAFWGTVVWMAFLLALIPLVSIVWTVVANGAPTLVRPGFLTHDMAGVTGVQDRLAQRGGDLAGGIQHALVGSLLITLAATVISVPIGLLTSIWLVEYSRGSWLSRTITFLVDVMTGIPSIVAGLFAAGIMMVFFEWQSGGISGGRQTMGITAAIALSVLMIPVVVRTTEEMLRVVPNELREASYALGIRKWRTIFKVVIPTAISGIASGVTLAIARVIGETAPILVTAGVATGTNWNLFHGWMMTLPVYIYRQLVNPTAPAAPDPSTARAWGAALVLIIVVMGLNLLARVIARRFAPKTLGR